MRLTSKFVESFRLQTVTSGLKEDLNQIRTRGGGHLNVT